MEREKKELGDKELLRFLQKGGGLAIEKAKEVLERGGISGEHLRSVLENIKATILNEEKVKEIKAKAEKILIEKFLDEKSFLTILNEGSPIGRGKATKKYRAENENISNYTLKKIIERVPAYRLWAAKKLRSQNPTDEEYVVILEELEGIDPEFQSETLEMFLEKRIPLDDASYLMGFVKSPAKRVWQELHKKGGLEELSEEHLEEMRLSDHSEISEWATKRLIQKLRERERELFEIKGAYLKEIGHLQQFNAITLIEGRKEEIQKIHQELIEISGEIDKLKEEL